MSIKQLKNRLSNNSGSMGIYLSISFIVIIFSIIAVSFTSIERTLMMRDKVIQASQDTLSVAARDVDPTCLAHQQDYILTSPLGAQPDAYTVFANDFGNISGMNLASESLSGNGASFVYTPSQPYSYGNIDMNMVVYNTAPCLGPGGETLPANATTGEVIPSGQPCGGDSLSGASVCLQTKIPVIINVMGMHGSMNNVKTTYTSNFLEKANYFNQSTQQFN